MEQKYDFKQIPSGWRYCFNAQCPMKDQCLRYQTAQALPESYEMGEAVFPGALKNGKCRFFRKDEKVVLATGFLIDGNPLMNNGASCEAVISGLPVGAKEATVYVTNRHSHAEARLFKVLDGRLSVQLPAESFVSILNVRY